ncbi:hypothetical protein OROMI_028627 [Orobanche minor]
MIIGGEFLIIANTQKRRMVNDDCNTASVKHVEDSNISGNVQQAAVDGPQMGFLRFRSGKKSEDFSIIWPG